MTRALCSGRPPEWWDTGDPGNRLALALCRVCPVRTGTTCQAGEPDPRPAGVIRAAIAYTDRRGVCPICDRCGYPVDDLPDSRRQREGCRNCRTPRLRSWDRTFTARRQYQAARYRRRKATCTAPTPEGTRAA